MASQQQKPMVQIPNEFLANLPHDKQIIARKSITRIQSIANTRFYIGLATWFTGLGIHFILLPYFALFILKLTPLAYASLYAASLGVALLLMPWRWDEIKLSQFWGPRLWRNVHILATVLAIGLIITMQIGQLGYITLLLYCIALAILMIGLSPLRDALQRLGGADIPRTLVSIWLAKNASYDYIKFGFIGCLVLQYLAQATGYGLALGVHYALPYAWGLPAALTIIWGSGIIFLYNAPRLHPAQDLSDPVGEAQIKLAPNFWGGVKVIRYAAQRLWRFLLCNFVVGAAIIAPFLLLVPHRMMQWQLDIQGLVLAHLAFWGGAMAMVGWLLYRPQPFLRGLVVWLTIIINALAIWMIPHVNTPNLLISLCLAWGLNNGLLFSNMRVLFQVACPPGSWHRAIIIYHYLFLLGTMIGLLGFGWMMSRLPLEASFDLISQYAFAGLLATALLALPIMRQP